MSVIVPVKVGLVLLVMFRPPLLSLAGSSLNEPGTSVGAWVSTVKLTRKSLPGKWSLPEGRGKVSLAV